MPQLWETDGRVHLRIILRLLALRPLLRTGQRITFHIKKSSQYAGGFLIFFPIFLSQLFVIADGEPMGFVADPFDKIRVTDNILENQRFFIVIHIQFFASWSLGNTHYWNIVAEFSHNILGHIEMPLSPVDKDEVWQWPIILKTPAQNFAHHSNIIYAGNCHDFKFPVLAFVGFAPAKNDHRTGGKISADIGNIIGFDTPRSYLRNT